MTAAMPKTTGSGQGGRHSAGGGSRSGAPRTGGSRSDGPRTGAPAHWCAPFWCAAHRWFPLGRPAYGCAAHGCAAHRWFPFRRPAYAVRRVRVRRVRVRRAPVVPVRTARVPVRPALVRRALPGLDLEAPASRPGAVVPSVPARIPVRPAPDMAAASARRLRPHAALRPTTRIVLPRIVARAHRPDRPIGAGARPHGERRTGPVPAAGRSGRVASADPARTGMIMPIAAAGREPAPPIAVWVRGRENHPFRTGSTSPCWIARSARSCVR